MPPGELGTRCKHSCWSSPASSTLLATRHGPCVQDVTGTALALSAQSPTRAVDDHVDEAFEFRPTVLNEQAVPCRLESQGPRASIAYLELTRYQPSPGDKARPDCSGRDRDGPCLIRAVTDPGGG
jgi:hypothetical protein